MSYTGFGFAVLNKLKELLIGISNSCINTGIPTTSNLLHLGLLPIMLACQDCKEGQHGIARRNQPKGLLLSIQHGEGGQSTRKKQKRPNEAATVSRRAVGTKGVGSKGPGGMFFNYQIICQVSQPMPTTCGSRSKF